MFSTFHRVSFHNANGIIIYPLRKNDFELALLKELLPFKSDKTTFVFGGREAPGNPSGVLTNLTEFHNLFNLTMTYRRDSDIYSPYAYATKLHHKIGGKFPKSIPMSLYLTLDYERTT